MKQPLWRASSGLGFTLIETTVASICTGVVVAGLASCLMIAGHVFDEDRTALTAQTRIAEPLDRVLSDLRYATAFTERTATAVTFRVPDRDGDTLEETIRYSWSGTTGSPLLMTYNGGTASILVPKIGQFNLAYHTRAVTGTGFAQGATAVEEVLLGSHDDATGGIFGNLNITASQWEALYIVPTLPDGTASWDLTKVRLRMRSSSTTNGIFIVRVCLPAGGPTLKPSDTALEDLVVYESALGTIADWVDFTFSSVTGLAPTQAIFVVVRYGGQGSATVAILQREISIADEPGYALYQTTDTGATWSLLTGELRFFAYGMAHY